jgi:hypothetical protein
MILTVQAPEVAARTGYGQTVGARMEMVEGLLLNGVDGQRARMSIRFTDQHTTTIAPVAADTRLALTDPAMMRTEQALHSPILQMFIIPTFYHLQISISGDNKMGMIFI